MSRAPHPSALQTEARPRPSRRNDEDSVHVRNKVIELELFFDRAADLRGANDAGLILIDPMININTPNAVQRRP